MSETIVNCDDVNVLGLQIDILEEMYMKKASREITNILRCLPNNEITLQEHVLVDTWNRGFMLNVKKLKLRSTDKSLMIVGEYNGNDNVSEFFSYLWNFKQIKRIVEQVLVW